MIEEDVQAFDAVMRAYGMPRLTKEETATRAQAIQTLAMATMDMIKHAGGSPAYFLDFGGGASPDRVAKAFHLVLSNPNVRAILVNIFAGINRCDWVARGVVHACGEMSINVPFVVRLAGTNVEAGRRIIADSGIPIISADTLADAAQKAVAACQEANELAATTT